MDVSEISFGISWKRKFCAGLWPPRRSLNLYSRRTTCLLASSPITSCRTSLPALPQGRQIHATQLPNLEISSPRWILLCQVKVLYGSKRKKNFSPRGVSYVKDPLLSFPPAKECSKCAVDLVLTRKICWCIHGGRKMKKRSCYSLFRCSILIKQD